MYEFNSVLNRESSVVSPQKIVAVVTADQVGKGRREGRNHVKHFFYISTRFFWCVSTTVPELAVLKKAERKPDK